MAFQKHAVLQLLIALGWIGSFPGLSFAQLDTLINELRTEAPKKWAEYERAFASKLRYSAKSKTIDKLNKDRVRAGAHTTIKYGTHGVLEYHQPLATGGSGYVFASNDRYAFELKKTDPNEKWVVTEIDFGSKENQAHTSHTVGLGGINIFSEKKWRFAGPFKASVWLPDFFAKNNFEITHAERILRGTDELVRFECSYVPLDRKKERAKYPHKGWVVLNPKQFWRVCESELEVRYPSEEIGPAKTHWTVECEMDGDYPVLKRIVAETTDRLEEGKDEHVISVTDYDVDRQDPDPKEFTLSAYGLPEPMGIASQSEPRYWLWFSAAGFAILAVVVLLGWRRRGRDYATPTGKPAV